MVLGHSWILKHLLSTQGAPAKYPLPYSTGDRAITLFLFYLGNSPPSKVTSKLPVLHTLKHFAAYQWKKLARAPTPGFNCGVGQETTFVYCVFFAEELEGLVTVGVAC